VVRQVQKCNKTGLTFKVCSKSSNYIKYLYLRCGQTIWARVLYYGRNACKNMRQDWVDLDRKLSRSNDHRLIKVRFINRAYTFRVINLTKIFKCVPNHLIRLRSNFASRLVYSPTAHKSLTQRIHLETQFHGLDSWHYENLQTRATAIWTVMD